MSHYTEVREESPVDVRADFSRVFPLLDGSHPDALWINKMKYKIIRQTHLVYLLFIVELATCFDPAG
jgi:hypothetical protein